MEDTLREQTLWSSIRIFVVLILVLMEDTLRARWRLELQEDRVTVLILVLMEDTLRVLSIDSLTASPIMVLILVLMEDTLRDKHKQQNLWQH